MTHSILYTFTLMTHRHYSLLSTGLLTFLPETSFFFFFLNCQVTRTQFGSSPSRKVLLGPEMQFSLHLSFMTALLPLIRPPRAPAETSFLLYQQEAGCTPETWDFLGNSLPFISHVQSTTRSCM